MAPQSVLWGRDNRGAMLRVLGRSGDAATRIENRIGEPMANPYLYIAAQIHAGLDGIGRRLAAPKAAGAPYAGAGEPLPTSLGEALAALAADQVLARAFTPQVVDWYTRIKRSELERHAAAQNSDTWQAREYFSRF
jgi:glutamine synthetase